MRVQHTEARIVNNNNNKRKIKQGTSFFSFEDVRNPPFRLPPAGQKAPRDAAHTLRHHQIGAQRSQHKH